MRWRKGHTFKHHAECAAFSGSRVLFKELEAQQGAAFGNSKCPKQEMLEMTAVLFFTLDLPQVLI